MPSPETVLVTGASSGIGRELAHCFARAGSTCVLLARSENTLEDLRDTLQSHYDVTAHVLAADLSVPEAVDSVIAQLQDRGFSIDVLVNNAGVGARGNVDELDVEQQLKMIRVNVSALTHLTGRLLPRMLDRRRGGILNVASTAAFQPGPYMSVYYATKAYVLSFSEGLTEEVSSSNVTISCLTPGPTQTSFVDTADMADTTLLKLTTPMSPATVAQAGYDGFRSGTPVVIPGWTNKISATLSRFVPRPLLRKVTAWLNA